MRDRMETFAKAPVGRAILKLSLPVIAGMMVQVLYNLVDVFFIGRLYDENQIAAANLTMPVFMVQMALAGIVGTGAASYISRCLGQGNQHEADRALSTGAFICLLLALALTILGLFNATSVSRWLGADAQALPYARDYVRVLFMGSVLVMLNFAFGQLLRAEGGAMPSMIGMMIGTVANVVLDPLFIFTFGMGVTGAAIATVIGNGLALLFYLFWYLSGKTLVKLRIRGVCLPGPIWREIFSIGTPATLSQLLASVSMMVGNNLAAQYGNTVLAGFGLAGKILTIGTFIFMGFGAGCQPLIGYNYGAGNSARVTRIFRVGLLMTLSVGVALTLLFGLFAPYLLSFLAPLPSVVDMGTRVLRTMMWGLPFLGPLMLMTTMFQAMGKAVPALILSVARQGLFYIPFVLLMNALWAFEGLVWAMPLTDALSALLALFMIRRALRRINQAPEHKEAPRPAQ